MVGSVGATESLGFGGAPDNTTVTSAPPEVDRALTTELTRLQRELRQPSLSAAVSRRGRLLWAGAVGHRGRPYAAGASAAPLTSRTTYRIGSITKPMVALALVRLAQAGRLDLDEPVRRRRPDWWVGSVTAAQLLSHTSGLRAEPQGSWWERAGGPTWDELCAQPPEFVVPPGGPVRYSNVGYAVLGRLLESLTGLSWDEAVRSLVWQPLGMDDTGAAAGVDAAEGMAVHPFADVTHHEPVAEYRAMGPAGQVWSTPVDVLRLAACLSGHGAGALCLDEPSRRRMTTPVSVWDTPGMPWTTAQGLGVAIWNDGGRRWLGHTGSVPGFTAELRISLDTADAAVVCGNATHGHAASLALLDELQRVWPAERPPYTPGPVHPAAASLAELAGGWFWGPIARTVAVGASQSGTPTLRLYQSNTPTAVTVFEPDGREWVGVAGGYWYGERLRAQYPDGGRRGDGNGPAYLDVGTFRLTRRPYQPDADIPGGVDPGGWS